MLSIQIASAGSGKTYALAKNYILNLIAYQNKNFQWKIRNQRQIEDALLHILAITFTNKATNEMKHRIVNNLASLSKAAYLTNLNHNLSKNIPYLNEFTALLNVTPQTIGKACETALRTILNNYSFFRISTIDSFFQEILRTFAYEANLNDSYQLEIDSTFVNDTAIETSIQELDSNPHKMGNSSFWMKTIMQLESKKSQSWNPFNKNVTKNSIYSNIKTTLKKLESEDFKEIKNRLDTYFQVPGSIDKLKKEYSDLRDAASEEREKLLEVIHKKAQELQNLISLKGYTEKEISNVKYVTDHIKIALSLRIKEDIEFNFKGYVNNKSILKKNYRSPNDPVDQKAMEFYEAIQEWKDPSPGSYYKNWLIYGDLIPYLGLLLEVRTFLTEVLDTNNLIQLSDTSYILKKIIGDDDAPFIYERLGNKIDHFLIDEFQDTSKMQWDVIHPLLRESISKGESSLIIGDPKQSIYRFRNANHKLISEAVPQAFNNLCIPSGMSIEENTNWRSHTLIVKFNNYFFKCLASTITQYSLNNGIPTEFNNLYSNVVQNYHNKEGKGYIEIRMLEKPLESDDSVVEEDEYSGESSDDWFDEKVLSEIGPLISSLIERGYDEQDIAVLVNTNEAGKKIVRALIDYNISLPENVRKLNFISEESLLVSSSRSVEIVIGVLKNIAEPGTVYKKTDSYEDSTIKKDNKTKYIKWNKIKQSYNIYSMRHPEMSPVDRIISFLNGEFENSMEALFENLTVPTLTSIIEAIIYLFIEDDLKNSEALYLSSLQDLVNEYSANHNNDPASFLEWWKSRGSKMSVSTPDGTNAVQIMTIHKSKGLEFKCVILPFANDFFSSSNNKREWRWVNTRNQSQVNPKNEKVLSLPPILPVKASKTLVNSEHEMFYREYIDQVLTDKINMYYVAFTRACNELYIFTKFPEKQYQSLSTYIYNILYNKKEFVNLFSEQEKEAVISRDDLIISQEEKTIKLGSPFTREEIYEEQEKKEDNNDKVKIHQFKNYYINKSRPRLRSVATVVKPSGEYGSPSSED